MENYEIETIKTEVKIKGNKNKRFNLKYLIEKENVETFLFGYNFVKANKDKCYLIIDNIDTELTYEYIFPKKGEQIVTLVIKDDDNIEFKGMFDIKIRFSDPFYNTTASILIDISTLEKLDVSNCKDLSYMFCGCNKVKNFDFLKNWDVSNCKNFKGLFAGCCFSDVNFLSSWKVNKATDLSGMFCGCKQLKNINACKNWNVEKVQYFRGFFDYCLSLIDVNALQNWNMSNAMDIGYMFSDCHNLENMNSLFKWKLNDKVDKEDLTFHCYKLKNIPSNLKKEEGGCQVY